MTSVFFGFVFFLAGYGLGQVLADIHFFWERWSLRDEDEESDLPFGPQHEIASTDWWMNLTTDDWDEAEELVRCRVKVRLHKVRDEGGDCIVLKFVGSDFYAGVFPYTVEGMEEALQVGLVWNTFCNEEVATEEGEVKDVLLQN